MKVILIGDYPADDKIQTGIQGVLVNLSNELTLRKEVDLTIVSLSKSKLVEKYSKSCKLFNLNFRSSLFTARREFKSIVREVNPDIIHLQGVVPGVLLYDRSFKDKFVVTQHAILSKERLWQVSHFRKLKFFFKELIEQYYLSKIKNIIFISEYNKANYTARNNISRIKHALIANPIDNIFRNFEHTPSISRRNELYFVGEIKKRKGLSILLEALSLVKDYNLDFKLHVIGGFKEKAYEKYIKQLVQALGLEKDIVFCGWKNQIEILKYTQDIPIFVLPSFQETLPLSIAEAMSQEKIVVASDVGGISEMISHGESGYLFPAGDANGLADIIKSILQEQGNPCQLALKAKEESKNYYPNIVVEKTLEFYRQIERNKPINSNF